MTAWLKDPVHVALLVSTAYALVSDVMALLPGKYNGIAQWVLSVLGFFKSKLPPVAALLIPVLFIGALGCNSTLGKKIAADIKACAAPAVQAEVGNLTPTVTTILTGGKPDWQSQLNALEGVGADFVICAVMAVVADLETKQAAVTAKHAFATTDYGAAAARGKAYVFYRTH